MNPTIERVRIRRLVKRITQKELSEMSGVAQSTIAQMERGEKSPRLATLEKILKALDMEIGLWSKDGYIDLVIVYFVMCALAMFGVIAYNYQVKQAPTHSIQSSSELQLILPTTGLVVFQGKNTLVGKYDPETDTLWCLNDDCRAALKCVARQYNGRECE